MELRVVRYETEGGVAVVTLDRPDRLNAWTTRMELEFTWAMGQADADSAVRAVVVTGAGRGFCAGADSRALEKIAEAGSYIGPDDTVARPGATAADFDHRFSFLLGVMKPIVAAVNGAAAGVGFVLMCFADVRFAAAGAKLTTSFARLGLPAEDGASWILPRLVGAARAADLLLSARVMIAEEAAVIGLVNEVLPPEEVLPHSVEYARTMARELSPSSLRTIKAQLYSDLTRSLDASATFAERAMDRMVAEPDFAEGAAGLREKRPPRFGGS
jgi:enoyl-CoA hydratase/carnithine racemase